MEFLTVKEVLKDLVLLPAGPLILALLGLALFHFTRWRRSGTALCAVAILGFWWLALPITADVLGRAGERYPALDLRQIPHADAIVILGGGARAAAEMHAERTREAVEEGRAIGRWTSGRHRTLFDVLFELLR